MRQPARPAEALVVGVYPSAFHVAWSPPAEHDPRSVKDRRRPFISSLAVDVEPIVFWDGATPTPISELERWQRAVQFDSQRHGTVTLGNNGPSGAGLLTDILTPLGMDAASVAFTDAVPWFFVKSGKGSQGDAITGRFNALARDLGLVEGSLPERPTPKVLVDLVTSGQRRDGLRREITDAGVPLVITLGQEALDATRRIADRCEGIQTRLAPEGYGAKGELEIDGATIAILPLVHPGFLRQTVDPKWTTAVSVWRTSRDSPRDQRPHTPQLSSLAPGRSDT